MARQTASARLRPAQGERTEIENRLSRAAALTPRRQRLMLAILENPDDTFYLSARALARRYRVDVATIVRTVQALGYRRYADFATDLRQHFVARVTPYGILEAASREKRSLADHAAHSVSRDVRGLAALQGRFRAEDAVALGRRIHRAKRTVIVGVDLASPLAMFFAYGLTSIGVDAEAPVGGAGTIAHRIRLLGRGDVVVAISFGRCLRITVDAAELARRRSVHTFGITDSDLTPLARHCDAYAVTPILSSTFTGSYVAPLAFINAVIAVCSQIDPRRSALVLRQREQEAMLAARWSAPAARETPRQS